MKLAIALYPVYNPNEKKAHSLAAKAWLTKIIGLLSGRSNLKLSVFFTGQMLEALNKEHKKEAEQLKEFIENKQLEFLGGAYNDAMLPLFPKELQELQLEKYKKNLSDSLIEPTGYFCKSNAWEISLIESLEKYGFEYALMPDVSVQEALGRKAAVAGWFAAEYGGSFIRILTYSQNLSYICQNSKRAEIINSLKKNNDFDNVNCIVLSVDLNETAPNEWLQALDTAEAESLNIEHVLMCQAAHEQKAAGKVNLISYSSFAPSCRDILLRMPEINFLHKRILNIYFKARALSDSKVQEKVFESLLNAMQQSYFNNTADGMLRNSMRFYANRAVMKAYKILLENEEQKGIRFANYGFFLDGNQQISFSNPQLECLIEPSFGGWIRSLAYRPSFSELACSVRADGEVSPLFLDHICYSEFENLDHRNLWIHDRLGAFLNPCESSIKKQEDKVQVILYCEQNLNHLGKEYLFKVEKVFSLKNTDAELLASVSITNNSFNAFKGEFATELCLGFRYDDIRGQSLKIQGKKIKTELCNSFHNNVQNIDFRDKFLGIGASIEMNKNANILCAPILGIGSVATPNTAQGLRLVIFRNLELKGQESEIFHIRIKLNGGGFFL